MTATIINLVMDHASYFDESKNSEASNRVKIELFFVIINFGNLDEEPNLKNLAITVGQMILNSSTLARKERDMFRRCCMRGKEQKGDKNVRRIMSKIGI